MRQLLFGIATLVVATFAGVMFFNKTPQTTAVTLPATVEGGTAEADKEPAVQQAALSQTSDAADGTKESASPGTEHAEFAPKVDTLRIERNSAALLAGQAIPMSETYIYLDEDEVTKVEVGMDGKFATFFDLGLRDKPRVLSVRTMLPDGSELHSADRIVIAPIEVADNTPRTRTEPDTLPEIKPIALRHSPGGFSVLNAAPEQPQPSKFTHEVALETLSYTKEGVVQLSGRGSGGHHVRVYLDNKELTTQEIDGSGQWNSQLPDVEQGTYTLRVDEIGNDGKVTSRVETPFKREAPQAIAMAGNDVTAVTVQPGSTLWAISQKKYGDGLLYVRIFEANSDAIANPDLIYPGQVFDLPN